MLLARLPASLMLAVLRLVQPSFDTDDAWQSLSRLRRAGRASRGPLNEIFKGRPRPTIDVTTGWCSNFVLEVQE